MSDAAAVAASAAIGSGVPLPQQKDVDRLVPTVRQHAADAGSTGQSAADTVAGASPLVSPSTMVHPPPPSSSFAPLNLDVQGSGGASFDSSVKRSSSSSSLSSSSFPGASPITITRQRTHSGDDGDTGAAMGLDIGGTLAKFAVFEPSEESSNQSLRSITEYIRSNETFGQTGIRNSDLTVHSAACGGTIFFITFETRRMEGAIKLIKQMRLNAGVQLMFATGGGAHKYADLFRDHLGIELRKCDELTTMIKGLRFVVSELSDAVYTLRNVEFNSSQPVSPSGSGSPNQRNSPGPDVTASTAAVEDKSDGDGPLDRRGSMTSDKVVREAVSLRGQLFPFVLCNIGSGVSIVQVQSPDDIQRISGTALGGSTFFGLCRLLTKAKDFAHALDLADQGDSTSVNLLVRDIYGGNYKQFNLAGDLTASFFGKVCREDNPREGVSDADVARALVIMITQNISQIAFLNARACGSERVIFTGNFLRHNTIACRTLAYGMNRWSQLGGRPIAPLFLKHEGCLGALGAFLGNYAIKFDQEGVPYSPEGRLYGRAAAGGDEQGASAVVDAVKAAASLIGSSSSMKSGGE